MDSSLPNVDWKNSIQRQIIIDDLLCGVLPVESSELSAILAWELGLALDPLKDPAVKSESADMTGENGSLVAGETIDNLSNNSAMSAA